MADTKVRTLISVFPTDTSTFDVTVPGETRDPTGCVVVALEAINLDTNDDDYVISFGVTDFTDVGQVGTDNEHGQTTTDCQRKHNETNIIEITDPGEFGSPVLRSATVAAIAGGVRFDPVQSGTAHRLQITLIFGSACKAFSDAGDGSMADGETQTIAHGLDTAPKAGIYGFNNEHNSADGMCNISIGFHSGTSTIKQSAFGWRLRTGRTTTDGHGRLPTDRVGFLANNAGGEFNGREMTTNDATNCIYTNRSGGSDGNLVGLLIECDDISVDHLIVDSPTTAASDWDYTVLAFRPQCVLMLLTRATAIDSAINNNEIACTFGFCAFDEDGSIHAAAAAAEHGIVLGNTNTQTRLSQALFLTDDDGTTDFDMDNPVLKNTGWSFAADDINTADGTVRKWPMLAFEQVELLAQVMM